VTQGLNKKQSPSLSHATETPRRSGTAASRSVSRRPRKVFREQQHDELQRCLTRAPARMSYDPGRPVKKNRDPGWPLAWSSDKAAEPRGRAPVGTIVSTTPSRRGSTAWPGRAGTSG
jgi:hypothetical protein